jgi:hypothetical protein
LTVIKSELLSFWNERILLYELHNLFLDVAVVLLVDLQLGVFELLGIWRNGANVDAFPFVENVVSLCA